MRIQVILNAEEKETFRRASKQEGLSLSAWFVQAAYDRLRAKEENRPIKNAKELRRFFRSLNDNPELVEPDWEEQKRLIADSKRSGGSGT